ncbi:MAG TPA: zinc-ribbon domain containing protein [Pyrinomonadaceae bacterium]|nr:zinc-ribbon domain containing protein [Pyrinomonadaceae bacterium]
MLDKRIPRERKQKRHKAKKNTQAEAKFVRHPLFGNIPLIRHANAGRDGKIWEWWQYDPAYQPALPRGAVRGDVSKQVYCTAHHVPKYFYLDEDHDCIQCGQRFTFSGEEQKYWYETLKFNFCSIPIRCVDCRRRRRSEHALREQIARAKADVRQLNPAGYVALARAIVEYRERTGQGNLAEAIAAARKAAVLWPASNEPQLWEGIAHALAGRQQRAETILKSFLAKSVGGPSALRTKAEKYLRPN